MIRDLHISIWKFILLSIFIFSNINANSKDSFKSPKNISDYSHRSWDSKNGFLPYSINTILQTRDGYLWVGTNEGLVRFDGLEFSIYNSGNTKAFQTNNISSLVEDSIGRLWIGCVDGGLLSYSDGAFINYCIKDRLEDNRILSMCLDRENNLWVGTYSDLAYILSNNLKNQGLKETNFINKIKDIDETFFNVFSIVCNDSGTLWVNCLGNTHIIRISPKTLNKQKVFGNIFSEIKVNCFFSDSKGRNWVGTSQGLKILIEGKTHPYSTKNGTIDYNVTTIKEDQRGNLWIGTFGNGLYMLDTAGYLLKFNINIGASLDRIMTLSEDKEGGIWIGTRGGGLHRLQKIFFKTYTVNNGLSDNRVWSICEASNNDVWIGTSGGLNKLSLSKTGEIITKLLMPGGETARVVRTIVEDKDNVIWVGTGKDILRYSKGQLSLFLSVSETRAMLVDSYNNLWIGGIGAGLIKVQKKNYQIYFGNTENINFFKKNFSLLLTYQLKTLCIDKEENLWIGTKNGLFRFKTDSLHYFDNEPGLTGSAIMNIFNDSKGTLWITAYGFGLFRFNPENSEKQFSRITRDNGLYDNTIYSILEDDYGKFWFGGNKGIFCITRQEINDFCDGKILKVRSVKYGLEAGMENIECNGGNHPSAIKSKDGSLWFPTMGGVVVVDPTNLSRQKDSSKVYIQKIVVDGIELPIDQFNSLEPGTKRKIEFRYTTINFSNPENVLFKYKLEGYDDAWIDAQNHRTINYLNLPSGRYSFSVLASNNEGAWFGNAASVSFEIPQHYWETTSFRITVGILIFCTILGSTRIYYSRKLKHKLYLLEQQRVLEQERLRISRDIHDEIGSRLTKITVLNETVKDESEQTPFIQEYTNKISNETKQVIENLDEIIWFINPGNDCIEHLGAFLREYITDYFSLTEIECICDFPDSYPSLQISPEVRRNSVLTVKEITNNIVKHASASKVNAKFNLQGQSILISLEDNGKGFNTHEPHPFGNGLLNMQKRIEEIGGKIMIKSVLTFGTEIKIFIPLSKT